jgi:DNA-directed RNA polymerase subunit beta'
MRRVKVVSQQVYTDEQTIPQGYEMTVNHDEWVEIGAALAKGPEDEEIIARMAGRVLLEDSRITIVYEDREEREYLVPPTARMRVENGQQVAAGDLLTEGAANPQDILSILGREAVQLYLVEEVQKVYRSQGVNIHDKHVEIIVRQLLRKVKVDTPGDTELLPGELVDRFKYEDINAKVLAEGGEPATAHTVLLGITRASLSTDSWLAAASFQETTRVLTDAAIYGKIDRLVGLKENVIIGKIIPAQHITPEELEEPLDTITPALAGAEAPDLDEEEEAEDEVKKEQSVARGGTHLDTDEDEELEDDEEKAEEAEDEEEEKDE